MGINKEFLEQLIALQKKTQANQPDMVKLIMDMISQYSKGWNPNNNPSNTNPKALDSDEGLNELWSTGATKQENGTDPMLTIMEGRRDITVSGFLPGIKSPGDLSIKLHGNTLFITGTSDRINRFQGESNNFSRTIRLPAEVEPQGFKATYRSNYLEIRLKKKLSTTHIINVDFL